MSTIEERTKTFAEYKVLFGEELNFPPLDFGHIDMSVDELEAYAKRAINNRTPVRWGEYFREIPDGTVS